MAELSYPDTRRTVTVDRDEACGARVSLTRWCGQQAGHAPPCDPDWPLNKPPTGKAH